MDILRVGQIGTLVTSAGNYILTAVGSKITVSNSTTGNTVISSIELDESSIFSQKIMSENVLKLSFISDVVLPIHIGDYIIFNSETYRLNRLQDITKISNSEFQYSCEFEGQLYDLFNMMLISSDGLMDFSYTAQCYEYIDMIVASMNIVSSGWTRGTVDTTIDLNIDFAGDTCRSALTKIAESFKLEFSLSGKTISMVAKIGSSTSYSFQYGRNNGLYQLVRKQVQDSNVVTRVYGFGGDKNIPSTYRGMAKKLVFEVSGNRYLEKNVVNYGLKVGRYINEEIFPQRTAPLTAVNMLFPSAIFDNKNSYIEDSSLDFDLNGNKIDGQTPKIVFKSGDLSGQEFEVWKYDATTKRMYINPNTETDGYILPNASNLPAIGDTYTLIGIKMPDTYVTAAETALQTATQTYLDQNSVPQVVYDLQIDPKYVKANSITVKVGDIVHVTDTDLGVNSDIRISELSYPIVNPNKITCVIADFVPYTLPQLVARMVIQEPIKTTIVKRKSAEQARIAAIRQNQLKDLIFDPDLYFDVNRIKPLSIETMYLKVGSKSQNLQLSGITFTTNYLANANSFDVSGGDIIHLQYSITAGNTWSMTGQTFTGLTSNLPYYLYAKCSKTALTGVWELTTEQKYFEDANFYYFWSGVLYDAQNSIREFEPVTGMIVMNGGNIKAGKLQSVDGTQYFDLDNMKFFVGDDAGSLDWNVTTPNVLTIHGAVMTDLLLASIADIGDLIVNHLKGIDGTHTIEIKPTDQSITISEKSGVVTLQIYPSHGAHNYSTVKTSSYSVSDALEGTAELSPFGIIIADANGNYSRLDFNSITSTGVVVSKGTAFNAANVHSPAVGTPYNLPSGNNLFIASHIIANTEWYLPDPAAYKPYEEIEIVSWNQVSIDIRPLNGDYINSYDNTQKKINLTGIGQCCKLRSNGSDRWLVTSLYGNFIAA